MERRAIRKKNEGEKKIESEHVPSSNLCHVCSTARNAAFMDQLLRSAIKLIKNNVGRRGSASYFAVGTVYS